MSSPQSVDPSRGLNGVTSVRRAIDLLLAFCTEPRDELALSDLAHMTGLQPATARRLAATLVDAGLLAQDHVRGQYRLGARLLELGFRVLDSIEVRRVAFPYLVAFHGQTHPRSASSLLIPDGLDMLNVERLPAREWTLSLAPQLGYRFPIQVSAAGRAYLAALDPAERVQLLDRAVDSPAVRADLAAEVERVRERGFGIADEEAVVGSRAVSAAILRADGRPVGGLLAQAAASEVSMNEMIETIAPRLVGAAAQISAALGFRRHAGQGR